MKRFINIFSAVAAFFALYACQAELPPIVINPDPVFDINGTYTVNTISIYDEEEVVITVSRVYGLSKEVEMTVGVDEALLQEYNTLNGTSYQVLPEQYYELESSVKLDKTVKSIEVPVVLKPKAFVAAVGLENAANYVLPISITESSLTLDKQGAMSQVILLPNIIEPNLVVKVPDVNSELDFIRGNPVDQQVVITAESNFTTVDPSKVTYTVNADAVATYNAANGTSYELLPSEYYQIAAGVLDLETMNYETTVNFNCHQIQDGGDSYLLPLTMTSDIYGVSQKTPLYVVVELTELRITVTNGGQLVKSGTKTGAVEMSLNSPLLADFDINLTYDASKVAAYNSANGTSYEAVDASKISITATAIPGGNTSASVQYAIDWKDMVYDDGKKYLIPLTLDESVLMDGTIVEGEKTVYVELVKSISGIYTVDPIIPMYPAGVQKSWTALVGSTIWLADGKTEINGKKQSASGHGHKYVLIYGGENYWVDGLLYFNIDFANEIADKPGCYPVTDLRDRTGGWDTINNHNSYFDSNTEEVFFDITIIAYSAPGGGKGDPLQDPSHIPGWAKYGRMHSKK